MGSRHGLQCILDLAMQHSILSKLPLATTRWRNSMYADGATIFINPLKEDLEAMHYDHTARIWQSFRPTHKFAKELSPPNQVPKY
jgi:hypothetical protein